MLTNPIYYGDFKHAGTVYAGIHEPIISKALFDRVQIIMADRWRYPAQQHSTSKAFLGLLRCAECGGAITAEIQKGHTYYRCTKRNKLQKCLQPYIREEALDAEISKLLRGYTLEPAMCAALLTQLDAAKLEASQLTASAIAKNDTRLSAINRQLDRVHDAFYAGDIERDRFRAKTKLLQNERKLIEEQKIELFTHGPKAWLEPCSKWVLTAQSVAKIASSSSLIQKKELAKEIFGSNLFLDKKKAGGRAVKPWAFLAVNELTTVSVQTVDAVRTFFIENASARSTEPSCPRRGSNVSGPPGLNQMSDRTVHNEAA
jgi:hypothetical protein